MRYRRSFKRRGFKRRGRGRNIYRYSGSRGGIRL